MADGKAVIACVPTSLPAIVPVPLNAQLPEHAATTLLGTRFVATNAEPASDVPAS